MSRMFGFALILTVLISISSRPARGEDQSPATTDAAAKASSSGGPGAETPKKEGTDPKAQAPAGPDAPAAQPSLHPRVKIETTLGSIVLELDAEKAPVTVKNFIQYANEGFYTGTIFHRVIADFMIQGGGFTVDMEKKKAGVHEPIKNEWRNGLKNTRGTIAMARLGGQADSATCEFFINVVDNGMLDQPNDGAGYCVFGHVVEGMDTVDKIRNTKLIKHPKYRSPDAVTPAEPVVIKSVKVLTASGGGSAAAPAAAAPAAPAANAAAAPAAANTKAQAAPASASDPLQAAIQRIEKETGKPITKTASGLMTAVVRDGSGPSPKPTDTVKVHYRGTLLDGKQFDSSYDRGQPTTFPLNGVIKGWTEGVGLMKVGEKRYFIIPPDLAYGQRGMPPVIPPNSTLVFEVELLGIQ